MRMRALGAHLWTRWIWYWNSQEQHCGWMCQGWVCQSDCPHTNNIQSSCGIAQLGSVLLQCILGWRCDPQDPCGPSPLPDVFLHHNFVSLRMNQLSIKIRNQKVSSDHAITLFLHLKLDATQATVAILTCTYPQGRYPQANVRKKEKMNFQCWFSYA